MVPRTFIRFVAVGAAGFAIDAGVLTIATSVGHVNLYVARLCSFACATLVTWLCNRRFVFAPAASEQPGRQYARYLLTQTCGAMINLALFYLLIRCNPGLKQTPVIPLMAGAGLAVIFNFSASRAWVFR